MAGGLRFKGTMSVEVDQAGLEARLVLSREGDLEYDDGALVRILSDAGVTFGYEIDSLVSAIQVFQKSKDSKVDIPAAHGVPASAPTPEEWQWSDALIPLDEEQQAMAARVFKAAGPPEVFQVRTEKVKVQKKIPGKSGIFGAGQEEVQTVIESREIKEKVLVDPNTTRVHWVESGTKLATVVPSKQGQPGKDLEGKAIPAPAGKVQAFFLGSTIVRQKAEVVAGSSGFLRVGRNWADLVPHRPHSWDVTYSADKTSAFLTFKLGDSFALPLTGKTVRSRMLEDGFSQARTPDETSLDKLLSDAMATGQSLQSFPLGQNRDGGFQIEFSPDRSKALLQIQKPLGSGTPFSLKDLGLRLREAQLKGFSFENVKGALQDFLNGPETELKDFPLAMGEPATRGRDQVLVYDALFLPPEEVRSIRESLMANPKFLESVPDKAKLPVDQIDQAAPVAAGQEFARIEVPEGGEGNDGVDVSGKPIPAPLGNEPELLLLSNVQKRENKLVSNIDGLLEVGTVDGAIALRVRPHVDAMAVVTRSSDNLLATLTLVQGRGTGKRLDRTLVDAALQAAQILAGLDQSAVDKALESALAGNKVERVEIARGIPAANDFERRLTFSQPLRLDAEGKRRCSVRAGEVAARYLPPEAGQVDGRDILGNLIPSPDMEVRSLIVSTDFSVSSDEQGRQVLTANQGGEVVFDGESLSLMKQVAVASVGGKSGNVKFPGEVIVAGAIETGGYVMAGNLKVKGRVGGALLSSDQNIQVADGIHGEGKAVLRAKRHISVGFVEKALVMAVGDVHVGKTALSCTFRVNGKVYQKATGGGIQGGLAKVRLGLDVMNLGSPSGATTTVSFGQDYLVEDQIQAEVKETDKLRESIVQLDVLMRKLVSPQDKDKLNAVRQKKVLLMKMLDKRNLRLINLRDKFDLHVPSEIVVRETLFPGVSIESHGRIYEPKAKVRGVRLVFNEQTGHIEEQSLD